MVKGGSMATIPKEADEELWYLRIVKNFSLPRDEDLSAEPPSGAGKYISFGLILQYYFLLSVRVIILQCFALSSR
ncbi:hypothetical protein HanHA300_Chr08g0279141 [Helianthus annuus]|nr:hypothetical protein HanHA300_Chr08g0279141 [Helianthus annuus]